MLYFAYASNMDPKQIKRRCPSARFVSIATLYNHRLTYSVRSRRRRCAVASIIWHQGKFVMGILYRINRNSDWIKLDSAEGFNPLFKRANTYERTVRKIVTHGKYQTKVFAFVYIGRTSMCQLEPSQHYIGQILDGANHWGLPLNYCNKLGSRLLNSNHSHL